jgi:UDP-3-O-acyl N-acetylglucosamine deacetylase
VQTVADGESALRAIAEQSYDLVLLDIWMPGMDGIEALRKIKDLRPDVPVVMISGHATIATAMKATKEGAADFLEKPLDLSQTLSCISAALKDRPGLVQGAASDRESADAAAEGFEFSATKALPALRTIVFDEQRCRGARVVQHTLKRGAVLYGQGLHTGTKSGLQLEPLPANSGIHFVGVAEGDIVPAHVDYVGSTGFATTLRLGSTQAGTIEHLMSAIHAYGIANLLIKCNGEVPVMDGSAREFCNLFDSLGVVDQEGEWYSIKLDKPVAVERGNEWIRYQPGDGFTVEYTLRYPAPVGEQKRTFSLGSVEDYKREIAPARTFGFVKDIGYLQSKGLALGGRFDNFLLIGENGTINDTLRFSDEPVRHKILDCIGDLYLLGRPLSGTISASMTGHSDNIELLKLFREEMLKSARADC